ncbi:hypothetical protein BH09BAC5_BH09BAC5_13500 [soil metagenome]
MRNYICDVQPILINISPEIMVRKIKSEFATLEKLQHFISPKATELKCSIEVDQWVDTFVNGTDKCLVVKKSGTAGAKIVFVEPGVVDIVPIAPSSYINGFRRGIVAMILSMIISSSQHKIANQVDCWIKEIEN